MVNFRISFPDSCFTLVDTDGCDKYYKIDSYGDWWWGKCNYLKVIYNDGLENYGYELGYFEDDKWVPMFGWGYDFESIV